MGALEEEVIENVEVVKNEPMMDDIIKNEMEQVEVPNIIDHNNNVTKEEAMGNDCHNSMNCLAVHKNPL